MVERTYTNKWLNQCNNVPKENIPLPWMIVPTSQPTIISLIKLQIHPKSQPTIVDRSTHLLFLFPKKRNCFFLPQYVCFRKTRITKNRST